jgi:hypothetical protein
VATAASAAARALQQAAAYGGPRDPRDAAVAAAPRRAAGPGEASRPAAAADDAQSVMSSGDFRKGFSSFLTQVKDVTAKVRPRPWLPLSLRPHCWC